MILAREKFGKEIDKTVFPGTQGGPLVHVMAAKAVCFLEAMQPEFVEYQKQVVANARALAASLVDAGFRVVSGGTDTHLLLLDVFSKGLRGKEAEQALDRARITVNKNAIPFDTNPPMNPSGIRLGSPAVTTRGFREAEMREVGALIAEVLTNIADEQAIAAVRQKVGALDGAIPALHLEARRRPGVGWRCTSSSTPGASGTSASGPTSGAWCTRWARIDRHNHYTLVTGPAEARLLAGLPENFRSAVYARNDHSCARSRRVSPVSARAHRRTWCTFR